MVSCFWLTFSTCSSYLDEAPDLIPLCWTGGNLLHLHHGAPPARGQGPKLGAAHYAPALAFYKQSPRCLRSFQLPFEASPSWKLSLGLLFQWYFIIVITIDILQTMFSAVSLSSFSTLAFSDLVEPTMTEIRTFRTLKRSEYNVLCYTMSLGTGMWSRTKTSLKTSNSLLIFLWRRNVSYSQKKISKNVFFSIFFG